MVNNAPLITISGPPASGTSTLSENIANTLDFEVVNGGDMFRRVAKDRGLSLQELVQLSEEDESIDKEIDDRLKQVIDSHLSGEREPDGTGLIVESRLAGWHAEGRADLSIYLDAPVKVRASRVEDRDETVEDLKEREKSDAKRYLEYYNIDITDKSIYDLVLDTSSLSIKEMTQQVLQEMEDELNIPLEL